MRDALFALGFALLTTHELDAVSSREWRVLPGFAQLPETIAEPAFVLAHVPLVAVLLMLLTHRRRRIRVGTRRGIATFLVVHAGLHLLFSSHRHYDFHGATSSVLIYAAAACGLAWLASARAPAPPVDQKL